MKLFFYGLFASAWLFAGLTFTGCRSEPTTPPFVLDNPGSRSGASSEAVAAYNAALANQPQPMASPQLAAEVARFRVGQVVVVTFSGTPSPVEPHEEAIKENGTITLPLIGAIYALGKTSGELQNEIYTNYVPKYYVRLNVTVRSGGERVYYVSGEVRSTGPQVYRGETTVTKAIQSAGGLNDFASHSKIWLLRPGAERVRIDYDEALRDPSKDLAVYPEDQIVVKRRIF